MQELNITIGHARKIANQYKNNVLIGRKNEGYYIIENKKQVGPFKKVFLDVGDDKLNNDKFIVGFNLDESKIYRIGYNGLELVDVVDTTKKLRKLMLDKFDVSNHEEFKDCIYFGKVDEYSVFSDPQNMFFVVNVLDDVMPIENYPKFEIYKDLTAWYRENKGIKLFSTDMYYLTLNSGYVKMEDIFEGVANVTLGELGAYSEESIKSCYPFRFVEPQINDFYSAIKKKLKLKYAFKFTSQEDKDKLKQEGYVKFNFRALSSFDDKYPEEYKHFRELCSKKYEELQREYFINNSDYLADLLKDCKPKVTHSSTFEKYYLPIIKSDYSRHNFKRILKYLDVSDSRIERIKKVAPEVYESWYRYCEKNLSVIKTMILEHRIVVANDMLNTVNRNIETTTDELYLKSFKMERARLTREVDECAKLLTEIKGKTKEEYIIEY